MQQPLGNLVDGECTGLTLAGAMQSPSVVSPTGTREIREEYCPPVVSDVTNSCGWGYYISTVYTYERDQCRISQLVWRMQWQPGQ